MCVDIRKKLNSETHRSSNSYTNNKCKLWVTSGFTFTFVYINISPLLLLHERKKKENSGLRAYGLGTPLKPNIDLYVSLTYLVLDIKAKRTSFCHLA